MKDQITPVMSANQGKFENPLLTAKGEPRASVPLTNPQTLWFNTGTLCNIECTNCYILSSPTNDALVYLTTAEVSEYLDQLDARKWGVREIAFTGGEPYMNPQMNDMTRAALERGYEVLILTNAMRPMMRKSVREGLSKLIADFGDKITFRVSLDHWSETLHDQERGKDAFNKTIEGMIWLRDQGAKEDARQGFASLFEKHDFKIDPQDPAMTVIFPEMDESVEVPEITTACWGILDKSPDAMMCASSRMVVKRRGAAKPAVLACTLLPYDAEFELGETLAEAEGAVQLNHPHCAKFCVLGGASCSG